jgi:carbon monoxide dehydrogenase subunit G
VARSESSVVIDRPPDVVFPGLLETDRRLRWVEGLAASEPLEAGEPRVGSRFRESIAQHGFSASVETTIDELDPPRSVSLRVDGRGFDARTTTRLERQGGGTRVVAALETKVGGLAGRVVGGVIAKQAQGSLDRSLAKLKQLVEAQ